MSEMPKHDAGWFVGESSRSKVPVQTKRCVAKKTPSCCAVTPCRHHCKGEKEKKNRQRVGIARCTQAPANGNCVAVMIARTVRISLGGSAEMFDKILACGWIGRQVLSLPTYLFRFLLDFGILVTPFVRNFYKDLCSGLMGFFWFFFWFGFGLVWFVRRCWCCSSCF